MRNTHGIWKQCIQKIRGIFMEYARNMYRMCVGYAWNMTEYMWSMHGICAEHAWNMCGICMCRMYGGRIYRMQYELTCGILPVCGCVVCRLCVVSAPTERGKVLRSTQFRQALLWRALIKHGNEYVEYAWNMHAIPMKHSWSMHDNVRSQCGICMSFAWSAGEICGEHNRTGIHMECE